MNSLGATPGVQMPARFNEDSTSVGLVVNFLKGSIRETKRARADRNQFFVT